MSDKFEVVSGGGTSQITIRPATGKGKPQKPNNPALTVTFKSLEDLNKWVNAGLCKKHITSCR